MGSGSGVDIVLPKDGDSGARSDDVRACIEKRQRVSERPDAAGRLDHPLAAEMRLQQANVFRNRRFAGKSGSGLEKVGAVAAEG